MSVIVQCVVSKEPGYWRVDIASALPDIWLCWSHCLSSDIPAHEPLRADLFASQMDHIQPFALCCSYPET